MATREERRSNPLQPSRLSDFKIAAAQVPSIWGDIDANIAAHAAAIEAAAECEVSVLVFPELSLTGYEPDLAAELAMSATDSRLERLLVLAGQHHMKVVVGAPLQSGTAKPALGAIVIDGGGSTTSYRKMHLGTPERALFVAGDTPLAFTVSGHTVGVAICADSSQPAHPQAYAVLGANIYAAGGRADPTTGPGGESRRRDHTARTYLHPNLVVNGEHRWDRADRARG
jgi:predicted amidohydrolase